MAVPLANIAKKRFTSRTFIIPVSLVLSVYKVGRSVMHATMRISWKSSDPPEQMSGPSYPPQRPVPIRRPHRWNAN